MNNTLSWVEINKKALLDNISQLCAFLKPGVKFAAVVKGNAYGHGIECITRLLKDHPKIDFFGVNSIEEAVVLKKEGVVKPIIILGYVSRSALPEVVSQGYHLVVYNKETLTALAKITTQQKKKVFLHLKIETGTYRQGVLERDLPKIASLVKENQRFLRLIGASTHFANIEDTTNHEYARFQLKNFHRALKILASLGLATSLNHCACSAALILFPETHFKLVRVGIALYGLWPSKETYLSHLEKMGRVELKLKPVLSWKTRIAQIKRVPKGAFIGYGCTYKTTAKSTLAILPVGYYDGYPRALSNKSYVLIRGERAPLRGRVCMNMLIVDITHIPGVKLEDEVILIGEDKNEKITADNLASLANTINYEIVSRINPCLPRKVV
jgi:alanine racemase